MKYEEIYYTAYGKVEKILKESSLSINSVNKSAASTSSQSIEGEIPTNFAPKKRRINLVLVRISRFI